MIEDFQWSEKYRPKTVADCILPERIKQIFRDNIEGGSLKQHLLLNGSPGIGKTTIARAIAEELDADVLFINASIDCNIDTLRNRITDFATSCSFTGKTKIVILDEADGLNPQSFQPGLKAFMETYSSNCKFILTANQKAKLIPAIHSRCATIEFNVHKEESIEMQGQFWMRLCQILDKENVTYNKKVLAEVVKKFYPDFRGTINELQKYSSGGEITTEILSSLGDVNIEALMVMLKGKEFTEARKWAAQNSNTNNDQIFRQIYDSLYSYLKPQSIPNAVIILGEYQYKAAFVADPEINLVACIVELMSECEYT